MTTEEGNKLIAEFMGVKIGVDKYSWRIGVTEPLREEHLAYHKEWGWLMPVVEKINRLELVESSEMCQREPAFYMMPIRNALCDVDIKKTWQSIIRLLEWYNKETNDKTSVASKADESSER
jgi:hypothetical protein